ncbi:MAG: regulatory protein RecX [Actinomycetota bacterium]|jgi:regulatory protein
MGAKQPLDCHERALRLLAVRPRARRELRSRLLRAGFETAEVEDELERLEAVGLVDDDAFAREVVEHEVTVRRAGRRAVVSRLSARGVDRETIERAIGQEDAGADEDRALALATDRVGRLSGLPPDKAFTRLMGFLARRGYDPSTARQAARRALEVDAAGPPPLPVETGRRTLAP